MRVELLIILLIALLISYGPTLNKRLGLRSLTFERTSDIVFWRGDRCQVPESDPLPRSELTPLPTSDTSLTLTHYSLTI